MPGARESILANAGKLSWNPLVGSQEGSKEIHLDCFEPGLQKPRRAYTFKGQPFLFWEGSNPYFGWNPPVD